MLPSKNIELIPLFQKCWKYEKVIFQKRELNNHTWFACEQCQTLTVWNHRTTLEKCRLYRSQIEKLILIFLDHKSAKEAFDILKYDFVDDPININTIRKYFTKFCMIALDFYEEEMQYVLLEDEVEIDETHLFKEKKSSAPHRPYKLSSIWLFGIKQRKSKKFFIIPLKERTESVLIPLMRKHIKIYSTIYSDSFAVYVNNKRKESKLAKYGFIHKFINHKIEFVSQISQEIHTNSIESLWNQIKKDLKKTRTTASKYKLTIARFYFRKMLSYEQQLKLITSKLCEFKVE